ncbi:uncharacterized protein LOC143604343 [Bidens hawaiensis]|uniref:uncharacterized protein LOC143604343 n=1 Tax=Bidens hawaiensis TaxID=980011 RepID=UPI00404919FB
MEHIVLVHYREVQPESEHHSASTLFDRERKFSIREISPRWGYATKPTKVLIIGTFTCDPSNSEWICKFGDTQVPVEIIQEGLLCCYAPPHPSGNVTLSITSGSRQACSQFEYHDKPPDGELSRSEQDSEEERLRIVEEALKKVRRQNVITHYLFSFLIVLTATWQISEVSIILKLKDGVTHPFRSIGGLFKSMVRRPRLTNGNNFNDDMNTITSNLIESSPVHDLKIPKLQLPNFDLGLND